MNIITKPATIKRGEPAIFTLDKVGLISLNPVAMDSYYADMTNWNKVFLVYKSNPGRQHEVVTFNTNVPNPVGIFEVSHRARMFFQLQYILIFDFDNDSLIIPRAEIPNAAAQFDVTLTP